MFQTHKWNVENSSYVCVKWKPVLFKLKVMQQSRTHRKVTDATGDNRINIFFAIKFLEIFENFCCCFCFCCVLLKESAKIRIFF